MTLGSSSRSSMPLAERRSTSAASYGATRQPSAAAQNRASGEASSQSKTIASIGTGRAYAGVVREAGVFVDSSCEEGLCSTCQVRVISGEIDHRDMVLTDAQKAAGDRMLTCISRAKPGEKLVLDL